MKVTVTFKAEFLMMNLSLQACGGVGRYTLPERHRVCELGKQPRTLVDYTLACTGKRFATTAAGSLPMGYRVLRLSIQTELVRGEYLSVPADAAGGFGTVPARMAQGSSRKALSESRQTLVRLNKCSLS